MNLSKNLNNSPSLSYALKNRGITENSRIDIAGKIFMVLSIKGDYLNVVSISSKKVKNILKGEVFDMLKSGGLKKIDSERNKSKIGNQNEKIKRYFPILPTSVELDLGMSKEKAIEIVKDGKKKMKKGNPAAIGTIGDVFYGNAREYHNEAKRLLNIMEDDDYMDLVVRFTNGEGGRIGICFEQQRFDDKGKFKGHYNVSFSRKLLEEKTIPVPKPGDTVRIYGPNDGHRKRGVFINGKEVFYISKEEFKAEKSDRKRSKDYRNRDDYRKLLESELLAVEGNGLASMNIIISEAIKTLKELDFSKPEDILGWIYDSRYALHVIIDLISSDLIEYINDFFRSKGFDSKDADLNEADIKKLKTNKEDFARYIISFYLQELNMTFSLDHDIVKKIKEWHRLFVEKRKYEIKNFIDLNKAKDGLIDDLIGIYGYKQLKLNHHVEGLETMKPEDVPNILKWISTYIDMIDYSGIENKHEKKVSSLLGEYYPDLYQIKHVFNIDERYHKSRKTKAGGAKTFIIDAMNGKLHPVLIYMISDYLKEHYPESITSIDPKTKYSVLSK